MATTSSEYTINTEILEAFALITKISEPKVVVVLEHLTDIYQNYLMIGCQYLGTNYDVIVKLIVESNVKSTEFQFVSSPNSLDSLAMKSPPTVKLVLETYFKYADKFGKLAYFLCKYKESLLAFLKNKYPNGDPKEENKPIRCNYVCSDGSKCVYPAGTTGYCDYCEREYGIKPKVLIPKLNQCNYMFAENRTSKRCNKLDNGSGWCDSCEHKCKYPILCKKMPNISGYCNNHEGEMVIPKLKECKYMCKYSMLCKGVPNSSGYCSDHDTEVVIPKLNECKNRHWTNNVYQKCIKLDNGSGYCNDCEKLKSDESKKAIPEVPNNCEDQKINTALESDQPQEEKCSRCQYVYPGNKNGVIESWELQCKICKYKAQVKSQVSMCKKAVLPRIGTIFDLTKDNIQKLIEYVKENPFKDEILTLNCKSDESAYMSGSSALVKLIEYIYSNPKIPTPVISPDFTPGDTDIFFLAQKRRNRVKLGNVDLVYTILKNIDEVLLNFDLPCCRVAIDSEFNYKVSVQCLASLYTGIFYMPLYCKSYKDLEVKYNNYIAQNKIKSHIDKLEGRYAKYKTRGFKVEYIPTEEHMNFIKNCGMYARERIDW